LYYVFQRHGDNIFGERFAHEPELLGVKDIRLPTESKRKSHGSESICPAGFSFSSFTRLFFDIASGLPAATEIPVFYLPLNTGMIFIRP
jgi:hypothetical protein